jgi:hypothetical protein|tara:strand:- start:2728 stop:3018 length:291 start_codon:yes stop_codon:yes gene_type:complete
MLIDTPFKSNDVITLRTTAGEELVARYSGETDDTISVTKPLALQASQQGIGLGPWVFTVDPKDTVKLNKSSILFTHKTEAGMANQYMEATTGLTLN